MTTRLEPDTELFIDALRGIAALMVLVCHAFELVMAERFGWNPDAAPGLWRFARASLGNGDFWVWCFFVISGLCIHRSIARDMAAGRFSWRRYALARITRLYPLFLLGLLLAIAAWSLGLDFGEAEHNPSPWPQLAATLLNLQLLTAPFPSFGPSWSLTCEVIYYAAWPTLLMLAGGDARQAALGGLAAALTGVAGILWLWHGLRLMQHSTAMHGLWTVCVLAPAWLAGAWLGGEWGRLSPSRRLWLAGLACCVLVMALEWVLRWRHYPAWDRHLTSWGAVPGLVILLAGAGHLRLSHIAAAATACRWLGRFSYPCYILHMPLLTLVNFTGDHCLPGLHQSHPALLTLAEIAATLALLALAGPGLESRTMAWRAHFLTTRPPA